MTGQGTTMTSRQHAAIAPRRIGAERTAASALHAAEFAPPASARDVPGVIVGLQGGAGNHATSELIQRLRAAAGRVAGDTRRVPLEPARQRLALSRAPAAVLQRCGSHPCPPSGCDPGVHDPGNEAIRGTAAKAALARSPGHGDLGGARGRGLAPPLVDSVLRAGGHPLDTASRSAMEFRFGHDFGNVRLHTGAEAARSARAVGASAYTVGSHIVVGEGFAAGSATGQRLLAHELVHVIQQEGAVPGVQSATPVLDAADPLESEAHAVADRVATGGSVNVAGRAAGQAVHRKLGAPALVPDAAGGCGICFRGDVKAVGRTAHEQIQLEFETMYPLLITNFVVAPPRSRYIISKGVPDLIMATATGFKVGEIKPANPEGYLEGAAKIEIYRMLLIQRYGRTNPGLTVEPMDLAPPPPFPFLEPASLTCTQTLIVNPPVGGVYGYFCQPPFSGALRRSCQCRDEEDEKKRRQQRQVIARPKEKPKEKEQKQPQRRVPSKVVGADPAFAEYAHRMQPPLVLPGQQFIVVFRDDLYTDAVKEMNRRQFEQTRRLMQVDPRGAPFLAVEVPLLGIAVVAGAIELAFVAGLVVGAIVEAAAAASVATVADVGAGTAVAADVAVGTASTVAPTLTVIEGGAAVTGGTAAATGGTLAAGGGAAITLDKAAAALVIAKLVAGGSSEAEAARIVAPLVGTRIAAVLEVSRRGGVDSYKPGQAVSINDGNTYRAAVALTTEESP